MKKAMLGVSSALMAFLYGLVALADEAAPAAAAAGGSASNKFDTAGWIVAAGAIGLGLAALGGALGQGRATAAALDGIARNPQASNKLTGPMILGLALIESLVLYAFVIALLLYLKLPAL